MPANSRLDLIQGLKGKECDGRAEKAFTKCVPVMFPNNFTAAVRSI